MDTDIHMQAIRRYSALVGELQDMSPAEREQARADRKTYQGEYISAHCCGWDKVGLLLRFMHEVCCIPLWQARECTVIVIRQNNAFRFDRKDVELVASQIAQETGNVLVAEATVALYIAAAEGTDWTFFWKEVLQALTFGQPMKGDDAENVTLH